MLALLCSDDAVELKKDAKFIDDRCLVLLSSESSNCLRPMFQSFQQQMKARRHLKRRIAWNAHIEIAMQNDYGDNENQEGEKRNAFEFVKEY